MFGVLPAWGFYVRHAEGDPVRERHATGEGQRLSSGAGLRRCARTSCLDGFHVMSAGREPVIVLRRRARQQPSANTLAPPKALRFLKTMGSTRECSRPVTCCFKDHDNDPTTSALHRTVCIWPGSVSPLPIPISAGGNEARPLRYAPDGTDFVITNGPGRSTARSTVAMPAFASRPATGRSSPSSCPGAAAICASRCCRRVRQTNTKAIWLQDAQSVVARYRPGSMVYDIRDPRLGKGGADLDRHSAGRHRRFGGAGGIQSRMQRRSNCFGPSAARMASVVGAMAIWAASGCRSASSSSSSRSIAAATCSSFGPDGFTLPTKAGTMMGVSSGQTQPTIADAAKWSSPGDLLSSSGKPTATPVLVQQVALAADAPVLLAFHLVRPRRAAGVASR